MRRLFTLMVLLGGTAMAADEMKRLPLCPDSPNCVSSQARDAEHFVEPLSFSGTGDEALEHMAAVIEGLPPGQSHQAMG